MKITKSIKRRGITVLLLALIISIALPLRSADPIQYYERESGLLETEQVAGEKWLVWLYNNPLGEATLWALAKRKFVSRLYGRMMDGPNSAKKINPFIDDFDVDLSLAQRQDFDSFNDFFTRKLKADARPVDTSYTSVVSPADGKILTMPILSILHI